MSVHDRIDEGKSQSMPGGFLSFYAALEEMGSDLMREAGTVIFHGEPSRTFSGLKL